MRSSGHVKENRTKVPELVEVNQMGEDDGAARKFRRATKNMFGGGGGDQRLMHQQHLCPLIGVAINFKPLICNKADAPRASNNASFLQGCS